jgi:hypothetical protein
MVHLFGARPLEAIFFGARRCGSIDQEKINSMFLMGIIEWHGMCLEVYAVNK